MNIDRDPTWGRAFNTFGEDPLLTGQTGGAEIQGIQGQGTMAMVKHFIAYDGGNNVVRRPADAARDLPGAVRRRHRRRGRLDHVLLQHGQRGGGHPGRRRDSPGPYSCGNSATLTGILRGRAGLQGLRHLGLGREPRHQLHQRRPGHGDAGHRVRRRAARSTSPPRRSRRPSRPVRSACHDDQRGGRPHPVRDGPVRPAAPATPSTTSPRSRVAADEQVVQRTAEDAATLLKNDGGALPLSARRPRRPGADRARRGPDHRGRPGRGERQRHRLRADGHLPGTPADARRQTRPCT